MSFTDYFERTAATQRGQVLRDILNGTALLQVNTSPQVIMKVERSQQGHLKR